MTRKMTSYPRMGKLALGEIHALDADVRKLIKRDHAARKAKQTTNTGKEIADILDDAFQCGVVIRDRERGCVTPLKRNGDVRKMHLARASHILWETRRGLWDSEIDTEDRANLIKEAAQRSIANGMDFATSGVQNLEPMFYFEPTKLWRDVPSRYTHQLGCLVRTKLEAESLGVDLPLTKQERSGSRDWYEVTGILALKVDREMRGERKSPDDEPSGYAVLSSACIKALAKAGMLEVVDTDEGIGVVPTSTAVRAWEEYAPWRKMSREVLKAERGAYLEEINHPLVYDWSSHPSEDGPQVCRLQIHDRGFWDALLPCHPRKHFSILETRVAFCGKVVIGSGFAKITHDLDRKPHEDAALGLAIMLAVKEMPGVGHVYPGNGFKPRAPGQRWSMHQIAGNPDTVYLRTFEKTTPETIERWSMENDVVFLPVMKMPDQRTLFLHSTKANFDVLVAIKSEILSAVKAFQDYGLQRPMSPDEEFARDDGPQLG